MKKIFTMVFAMQLMVNTIVIFYVLLIKQVKFLYVMFGVSLAFQTVAFLIISMLACSKSPFIQIENKKFVVVSDPDTKGGKK